MKLRKEKLSIKWVLKNLKPWIIILMLMFGVASSFEGVLNGYILGYIPNLNVKNGHELVQFGIAAVTSYLVVYSSTSLFLIVKQKAIQMLNESVKSLYFTADFASSFQEPKLDSSEVLNNITSISKQIETKYFEPLFMFFQSIMTVVSSTIVVLKTNLVLGLIYLGLSFLSLSPSYFGKRKLNEKTKYWSRSNSIFLVIARDLFAGRYEIVNFGVQQLFFDKFKDSLHKEEQSYFKLNLYQYFLQFMAWIFSILIMLLPIFIGLWMAKNNLLGVTVSTILTLTLTADHVNMGFRELTDYNTAIQSTADIRNITVVENTKEEHKLKLSQDENLEIKNLSVNRGDKKIISGLNMSLESRQKVIIAGPSGVGKSTLLNAIAGYIPTSGGKIEFAGHKLNYEDFVFISQEIWLFEGTVRANLSLYQNYTDEQLLEALQKVDLDQELGENALNFVINERGKNLSGGQAQRLAVARGLLRNKKLFLLDEITSALDAKNADDVHKLVYSLPSIVIEVAHNYNPELARQYNVKIFNLGNN